MVTLSWSRPGMGTLRIVFRVSAKDATMVAAISYDKLRLSLNLPTSIRATSDNSLEALAKKFETIGKKYHREVIVVTPPDDQ